MLAPTRPGHAAPLFVLPALSRSPLRRAMPTMPARSGLYRMPFGTQLLNTRFVPVRPGWVRTFASFDFLPPGADTTVLRDTRTGDAIPPPPAPPPPPPGAAHQQPPAKAKAKQPPAWLRSLNPLSWLFARVSSGAIPHWVVNANTLGDQDVVIQHEMVRRAPQLRSCAQRALRSGGRGRAGRARKWLRLAQGGGGATATTGHESNQHRGKEVGPARPRPERMPPRRSLVPWPRGWPPCH